MKTLINQTIELPAQYSVSPEAAGARAALVQKAQAVLRPILTAEHNEEVAQVGSELQTYKKAVQEMRVSLTRPFDDAKALLIRLERDHLAPIETLLGQCGREMTLFRDAENERVAREEAARQAEFQRLENERQEALQRAERARKPENQAKAEIEAHRAEQAQQAMVAAVLPTVAKAKGAATKQLLRHKVLDVKKVYQVNPHLCDVTVKSSAVNSTCVATAGATEFNPDTTTVPGLALYWENKTDFRRTR